MNQIRVKGGVLLGALMSGALAAGTLAEAPTAKADCASFFGVGSSADCTSTLFSVAIAIGTGATAHAYGPFGTAFAFGNGAAALTGNMPGVVSVLNFATAIGPSAFAYSYGISGFAAQVGPGTAGAQVPTPIIGSLGGNIAIGVSPGSTSKTLTVAGGIGNVAINLFGNASAPNAQTVGAGGVGNIAVNFFGDNNHVFAEGQGPLYSPAYFSVAFNTFGSANKVTGGSGPAAIAGAIGLNGQTITKAGPGLNINGFRVGGAAAVGNPKTDTQTAAGFRTATKTARPAAASSGRGTSKR